MLTIITEGTVFLLAIVLSWLCKINLWPSTENIVRDLFIGTLGAMVPLVLFVLILSERVQHVPLIGPLRKTMINDIRSLFSETKLSDLFFISVFAGVAEELLFRGIIQVKIGIIAAGIIFGLLHFITPAYFVIATIMGFYLGHLMNYYDSIIIPIQLHFVYDFVALVYLRYFIPNSKYVE